jgi:hypothetical protein
VQRVILATRICARRRSSFPFEGVLETADGVLNLALYLVGRALRLKLGITNRLADHLLESALNSIADPKTRSLSMISFSNSPIIVSVWHVCDRT